MLKESDIIYENTTCTAYVIKVGKGHYEVNQNGFTHAVRKGTFHFKDNEQYALQRAIAFCDSIGKYHDKI